MGVLGSCSQLAQGWVDPTKKSEETVGGNNEFWVTSPARRERTNTDHPLHGRPDQQLESLAD